MPLWWIQSGSGKPNCQSPLVRPISGDPLQVNKELQDEPIWPLFGAQIAQNTKDTTGVLRFLNCSRVSNAALDDPKRLLETKPFLGKQSPLVRPISRVRGVGPLQLTSFA